MGVPPGPLEDRYRQLRQLGEGGAGRVWLVEDGLRPGSRLALKELAERSRGHEDDLRREFATLAGLRHPNLVEVHDLDVSPHTGLPRFTLEYVDGDDVVETIRREGPNALPRLAAEVLRALAFLHDFGLVHRDLKPGNVLVRRTPRLGCRVVVLDFGLAMRGPTAEPAPGAAEASEAATGAAGTLPYLAPELFEGEQADRRSDLYALGVVLYEAVHGRTPFTLQNEDVMSFISAVREGRRTRPALPEGYPEGLAGWLDELLTPDPSVRPGDALEVLARLNAACGTQLPAEIAATRAARLGSGKPAGRDAELGALWEHLDPVEGPRVVWLCGGAGSGKTRVLRWLGGEAVARGWDVESPPPGLSGIDVDDLVARLRERAVDGPTLLLMDELESATGRAAQLLERVGREGKSPPLRVVAALRPAELRQPVVRKLLEGTGIVPTLRRVDLEPFDAAGVTAMAERATGSGTGNVSDARVEWLLEASEGNPLLVESLLVEGTWEKGGQAATSATIAESIAGRLELLSGAAKEWLEALAVLGEPSPGERVATLIGLSPEESRETAGEVAAAGLAREIDGIWAVESRAVAQRVVAGLEEERGEELHRAAADFVAGDESVAEGTRDWQLARLWSGAADREKAIEHSVKAAEEATQRNDHVHSAEAYRFALVQLNRRDARRRELRLKQADALLKAGSARDSVRASGAAIRLARNNAQRLEALISQARALHQAVALERTKEVANDAQAIAESMNDVPRLIEARILSGTAMARAGEETVALPIFEQVLADARSEGDIAAEATALQYIGLCRSSLRLGKVEQPLLDAMECFRKAGKPERILKCEIGLAITETRAGEYEKAWKRIGEILTRAAETNNAEAYKWAISKLSYVAGFLGRHDEAIRYCQEAEDNAMHVGDLDLALSERIGRADALIAVGRPAEAEETVQEFLSGSQQGVSPLAVGYARLTQAEASMAGPSPNEELIRSNITTAVDEFRRLNRDSALILALLVEMERLSRRNAQEPMRPVLEEFDALVAESAEGVGPHVVVRAGLARSARLLHDDTAEAALEVVERAVEDAKESGMLHLEARALAMRIEVLRALSRTSKAESAVRSARDVLRRASERIRDPDVRRDFLNQPAFRSIQVSTDNSDSASNHRLLALYDLIQILNSQTDPEALLESILDMALEVVHADRGMILLLEPGGDTFRVRVARNVEKETEKDAQSFSHSIVAQAGEGRSILAIDAGNDERFKDLQSVSLFKIRSLMCVPLRSRGTIVGTVYLDSRHKGKVFKKDDLRFAEAFADHAALALENARTRARLETENRRLLAVAEERSSFDNIIGRSAPMQSVFDMIEKVAASELPVLIQGESGTGKELVARAIHFNGPRKDRLILSENCAAIPESLLESELFGHVKGAFTGADKDRPGLFEQADGGTLFLDEVGDMSPAMQARLLRVLEDGEVRHVGGESSTHVDVRVLAATNRDIQDRVGKGLFREDLLYRLQVLTIALPPLRERHGDIALLVAHMLQRIARERDREAPRIEPEVLESLERYGWPGNVRQLENTLQRLVLLASEGAITPDVLAEDPSLRQALLGQAADDEALFSLERTEREQIRRALDSCGGNRNKAARLLGISRATIYRKIKEYEIN